MKRAYRSLAATLHPDKHQDESLKDDAKEAFSRVQDAYEVLSDPQKRQVSKLTAREPLALQCAG